MVYFDIEDVDIGYFDCFSRVYPDGGLGCH